MPVARLTRKPRVANRRHSQNPQRNQKRGAGTTSLQYFHAAFGAQAMRRLVFYTISQRSGAKEFTLRTKLHLGAA
jgi:hypothetical protein